MRIKTSASRKVFSVANYTLLISLAFICLYPFYYIFIFSISDPQTAAHGNLYFFPKGLTLLSYQQVLSQGGLWHAAFISVSRTVLGTVLSVLCTSMFGYVLTQSRLKFRKAIYRMVIITMYVSSGLIPYYVVMQAYGLKDNFLLYILPGAISAFNLVLVKTYIEQIPHSLEEAAFLDGAGYFTVFRRIIFPLCKPIVATIAIFVAVGQWNSWFDNFLLADKPWLQTLQYLLYQYIAEQSANATSMSMNFGLMTQAKMTPISIRMTVTMVVTLPILFVYPIFQKYFIKGIMIGAVKG